MPHEAYIYIRAQTIFWKRLLHVRPCADQCLLTWSNFTRYTFFWHLSFAWCRISSRDFLLPPYFVIYSVTQAVKCFLFVCWLRVGPLPCLGTTPWSSLGRKTRAISYRPHFYTKIAHAPFPIMPQMIKRFWRPFRALPQLCWRGNTCRSRE